MLEERPSGPAHVLVVDDDAPLRQAIERGLTRAGFQVTTAASGAEALALARTVRLDAAVIDVLLPDAGGLGVARALRQHECLASVPIVFMTALSLPVVRETLAPAPVLFKPFTYGQLLRVVRQIVP